MDLMAVVSATSAVVTLCQSHQPAIHRPRKEANLAVSTSTSRCSSDPVATLYSAPCLTQRKHMERNRRDKNSRSCSSLCRTESTALLATTSAPRNSRPPGSSDISMMINE